MHTTIAPVKVADSLCRHGHPPKAQSQVKHLAVNHETVPAQILQITASARLLGRPREDASGFLRAPGHSVSINTNSPSTLCTEKEGILKAGEVPRGQRRPVILQNPPGERKLWGTTDRSQSPTTQERPQECPGHSQYASSSAVRKAEMTSPWRGEGASL